MVHVVFNPFQLNEERIVMGVLSPTESPAIVGENRRDDSPVLLEAGQHVVIKQMRHSHWQLAWVQPSAGIAAVTADGRLEIH